MWTLSDADLLELRADLETTRARLDAQVLVATREIDGRGAAVATGAASTAAWLRHRLLLHPAAAKGEVALAKELDGELAETGQALRTGEVTRDQAAAVATAMRGLPDAVDPATRRLAEHWMLTDAAQFDVAAMHKLGRHLVQVVDPEGGAALERDEARHAARQEFTLTHGADGSRRFRGRLGPEGGALIDAALAAVSGPRPAQDGTPDPRTPGQRRAEGLLELIVLATQTEGMPEHGGEPVTMTVITTRDYLARTTADADAGVWVGVADSDRPSPPAATLEDGTPLSPEAIRRLGCDAWLVAAIVDTDLDVLDIGRMSRVIPRPMRRALVVRDQGCAFPGCGRPPRWCHGHHIRHWAHGGPTALSNLVLLCGRHHRVIHHHGWDVDIGPDGHPRFYPPPWIDPSRAPRPPWRPPHLTVRT